MKRVALNWVWTLVLVMLFCGTEREVYGQSKTYLNGQKTGNRYQTGSLIGLGPGSAKLTAPMETYQDGCLVNEFKYYYGDVNILNASTTTATQLIAARTLGVAGLLGTGADVYFQIRNTSNTVLQGGTTVYFKLKEAPVSTGIDLNVGGLLGLTPLLSISGGGYIQASNYKFHSGGWGVLCSNAYNGNENAGNLVGTSTGTKTLLLIDEFGEWYAAVTPDADFNSVRLNLAYPTTGVTVLSALSEIKVNIYNAFTQSFGGNCNIAAQYTSPGEASGIALNAGALGLNLSQLIANPQYAINNNSNEYASYSSGVLNLGVASTISQTIYFDHVTSVQDAVKVRLGLSNSLIGLGVGKLNAIKFIAYKGVSEIPVWSGGLEAIAQLLGLDLLNLINLGGTHKEVNITFKPNTEFDRIKIEYDAGLLNLGVIGDALRVYNMSLAPAAPLIVDTGQPHDVQACAGENAILDVTAIPAGGTSLTYQWQVNNSGSWVNIGATSASSSLTLSSVQISDNTKRYRVIVTGGNAGCLQTITSEEALLTVLPLPKNPSLSIQNTFD
ncbi:hypothetical protein [Sphingobacterium sp. SYP-B4668]|uniref:hypothetical protein n=1 Tax=Sphingobacterium sp. SYP-B4668 TaxID=2996035 RepID=UPI0022DE7A55|nr:hypothetical protein [Sphingobacterium sp. SYP-B4668]